MEMLNPTPAATGMHPAGQQETQVRLQSRQIQAQVGLEGGDGIGDDAPEAFLEFIRCHGHREILRWSRGI
jgi:hypothetical protein